MLLDDVLVVLFIVGVVVLVLVFVVFVQCFGLQFMFGLSWQGVELQVQGSYYDLQCYVQVLECELFGLCWGEMWLSVFGLGEVFCLVV